MISTLLVFEGEYEYKENSNYITINSEGTRYRKLPPGGAVGHFLPQFGATRICSGILEFAP